MDIYSEFLVLMIKKGDLDTFKEYSKKLGLIDFDIYDSVFLRMSVKKEKTEFVKYLLEKGADASSVINKLEKVENENIRDLVLSYC